MNRFDSVVPVSRNAYRRSVLHDKNDTHLPIFSVLVYVFFCLMGMLLYKLISPSPQASFSNILNRFLFACSCGMDDLPQNFLGFFCNFRTEGILLALTFLSSLTFLSPLFTVLLCSYCGSTTAIALLHGFSCLRAGLLSPITFACFFCNQAIFSALLIFFCQRSLALSSRLGKMGWRRFFTVCRIIGIHFLNISVCYLFYLIIVCGI